MKIKRQKRPGHQPDTLREQESDATIRPRREAMNVSLPTFRKESGRFVRVADATTASKAACLLEKHRPTITQLKERLGFQKDETVIAWLLEQIELSPDLDKAIGQLIGE